MKTEAEISKNIEGCKNKLKEHDENIVKFGLDGNLNAEKTKAYINGWINALKFVLDKGE